MMRQARPLMIRISGTPADCVAQEGDPLYSLSFAQRTDRPFLTVWRRAPCYLIRVHSSADFSITPNGTEITCRPLPTCPPASLEQLLLDQILPRVMHLRAEPCLHASAAQLPGGGVAALVGPAGSAKSTTCAALCRAGSALVCDDALRAVPSEGDTKVLPSYGSLRLWPDSADALAGGAESLPLASPRTSKRRLAQALASGPLQLSRVYALEEGDGPIETTTLDRTDALQVLAASILRLDPDQADALEAEFHMLTGIVAQVPVVRLRFRHEWSELDQLVQTIMAG